MKKKERRLSIQTVLSWNNEYRGDTKRLVRLLIQRYNLTPPE